jgi:hypothetical protein
MSTPRVDSRAGVAELLQPDRGPAGAPGGVDDEVGAKLVRPLRAVRAHAGDQLAARRRQQARRLGPVVDLDAGQRPHALADVVLEERAGEADDGGAADLVVEGELVAAELDPGAVPAPCDRRPAGLELGEQAGEHRVHDLRAAGEQQVQVPALRHALAGLRPVRERVALEDRDPLVRPVQRPGGQQPAHARADHDRVAADLPHRAPFPE